MFRRNRGNALHHHGRAADGNAVIVPTLQQFRQERRHKALRAIRTVVCRDKAFTHMRAVDLLPEDLLLCAPAHQHGDVRMLRCKEEEWRKPHTAADEKRMPQLGRKTASQRAKYRNSGTRLRMRQRLGTAAHLPIDETNPSICTRDLCNTERPAQISAVCRHRDLHELPR